MLLRNPIKSGIALCYNYNIDLDHHNIKNVDMIDDLLNYKLEGIDKQVVLLSNLEMWKEYESLEYKA
ncbi:DUF6718 family protein [Clostridium gasigenes]|uniref:DUF6718 family protein n=1 Tax=Clostridium gasigenes TaxID=94869 RepID=UPI00339924E0